MATTTKRRSSDLSVLRSKAALFDELVERLEQAEDQAGRLSEEVRGLRSQLSDVRRANARDGVDPAWRDLANELAGALRPYSLFRDQAVEDGRIIVHTRVPGATLYTAAKALDRLARQIAIESYREHGIPVPEDQRGTETRVRDAA
jgi:hypothetical protein